MQYLYSPTVSEAELLNTVVCDLQLVNIHRAGNADMSRSGAAEGVARRHENMRFLQQLPAELRR